MIQQRGRITASLFHDVYVLKHTTSPASLCHQLLRPKNLSYVPAIKCSIDNEERARQQYIAEISHQHEDLCCE